ncbi:MAG: Hsp20/alpha crystallin family protein [Micrococcus sp.]|nr:Hsp20/alpha crystallin family protein [Micrococcus sp.]
MSELLRRGPFFDRRMPFEMAEPFRRLFEGEMDKGMIRVEEESRENELCIRAELPGVDPDQDIDISVADGVLTITAERRQEERHEDKEGFRSEFRYGSFYRSLPLPANATAEDISASYKDGVLEITVPVPQPADADSGKRRIQINRA